MIYCSIIPIRNTIFAYFACAFIRSVCIIYLVNILYEIFKSCQSSEESYMREILNDLFSLCLKNSRFVLEEECLFLVGLVSLVILEAQQHSAASIVVLLSSVALVRCPSVWYHHL